MADNDYENYSDDDYLAELKDYVDAAKKEKEQDEAERHKQLAEMVGGYMGLWWYLRSFSASAARNIRTYAAIADREAKVAAWKSAADRERELSQYRDLPGSKDQQVMIINEFGACQYCLPYVGKTYSLGDAQELVPFHPNCRCTLVRVEDDSKPDLSFFGGILAGTQIDNDDNSDDDYENIDQEPEEPIEIKSLKDVPEEWFALRGIKAVDGTVIKQVNFHAIQRAYERDIKVEDFKKTLVSDNTLITEAPGDDVFWYNGDNDVLLVVNKKEGKIITVYHVDEVE
ncbi:DUF4258 domain-containing protein [Weissella confusa]|uniref:DUF4258 domain-containing protein n=1 Tax=Weissella confusa TaxID=1583 RepID=A0AA41CQS4_WEICO|nr:DUF4258 domain-containing protein [Weissella confusa]MBJ7637911.1 DUF4258 domain-containing protein [Weissella confusa]